MNWFPLNRLTYIGLQDGGVVAIVHWASDHEEGDAGYYLTRVEHPRGVLLAAGEEPDGEWPEEILHLAGRAYRELWSVPHVAPSSTSRNYI
jgi:hypothetical protein